MEIEAKYAVTGTLQPDTVTGLDLSPYQLVDRGIERHSDVVLDTLARNLTTARQALRIRRTPDATLMTLKGPATHGGTVFQREEIEAPVAANAVAEDAVADPERWPAAIAARVLPLLNGAPLKPLVRVEITRHLWHAMRAGEFVAEIALDDGEISAGGRQMPIHELEIELKGEGTPEDLRALSGTLRRALPLAPEPLTKLERGLALLDGRNPAGEAAIGEVGRLAIAHQLQAIRAHEQGARDGKDADAIHDMRVAVRRVRTMLHVLSAAQAFERQPLERLRTRLRALAASLGAVRDADVLLVRATEYAVRQPDLSADLAPLRDHLRRQRTRELRKLTRYLASEPYARALDDLAALITGSYGAAPVSNASQKVAAFAGGAIWLRYERILGFDAAVEARDPWQLHRLRIRCKRLRYTLEMFAPQLGAGTAPLIRQLKHVQDDLGELHDAIVAGELVARLIAERHETKGLAHYRAALEAEVSERMAAFVGQWRALSGLSFREPLAALIGAL
jgi:triphosphatase